MKRKLCSVLLALCMVLTLLPVSAMADVADAQSATSLPAADENGVITLMENVTLTSTFVVNAEQDLTLDLNGYSLTNAGTVILNNGRLTIRDTTKNGSIVSTNYVAISAGHNSTTTIEYANVRSVEGAVITSYATGATITIKDGVFSASDNAVIAGNGNRTDDLASGKPERVNPNTITINGGEFNGAIKTSEYVACGIYAPWKDNITVNGGTFNTTGNAIGKVGDSRVVVPCSALVFDSEAAYPALTNDSKITVNNGTFNSETSTISTMPKADDTNERVVVNSGTYSDLSALDYLASGATVTVKLAADTTKDVTIPAGATVTLDLNGKTLTNVSGHTITNNGNLTVTGSGTVDNVTNATGALYNCVGATAILNGGTFTRSQEAGTYEPNEGNGNSWYTMQNDGTMTINAGTTVTTRLNDSGKAVGGFSSLIRNGGNAGTAPTLLINGGHFNGGINTVKNDEGGTLTIKGGDFSNTTQYVIMNWNIADIYDGTFEAQSTASAVLFSSSWKGVGGTLNFHGGNVKTTSASQKAIRDYWDKNNKGNVAVSGGIFTVNPTAYVADTHIARKDGDAQYTVVAKSNLTSGVYTSDPSSALAPGYVSYKNSDNTYTVYYPVPVTPGNNNNSSSTTTKNPDGSTTTTTTDKTTGTVTETTKNPDGSTTTVETKKDGSVTETNKTAGGSVGTVKSDANGNTEISASISAADVNAAAKKNEPVAAPVSVAPAASPAAAPVIKLSVPASAGEVSVVIPVTNAQQGTVAIKVNPDGTEEIIKTSVVTKDGVVLGVKGSAQIKIVNNDKDFSDTVGHWAESDVDFVSARELFTGTAPQTFSPESATTRGMVVTVLARLAGESTDGGANWYDKGCAWAVTNGVSDGTDPNGTVTREQLAAMLYRYFGSPAVSGSLSFADASSVSEYAHDAMQWCVNNGIINGMDGLLNPQGQATRAQVSAMFARYIRLMSTK